MYRISLDRIIDDIVSGRMTAMAFIYRNDQLVGMGKAGSQRGALLAARAKLRAWRANQPARLTADAVQVTAGKLGAAVAYGSWDAPRGFQWLALGGQSTGHTEALRIVSGSETAVHPAGWPEGEPRNAIGACTALRLTVSDLLALESGLEDIAYQIEATERRYGRGSQGGRYGNGY